MGVDGCFAIRPGPIPDDADLEPVYEGDERLSYRSQLHQDSDSIDQSYVYFRHTSMLQDFYGVYTYQEVLSQLQLWISELGVVYAGDITAVYEGKKLKDLATGIALFGMFLSKMKPTDHIGIFFG